MNDLFPVKAPINRYLAVLAVFLILILPACGGGGDGNGKEPTFTEIGAGYAVGPFGGNPSARYWTLDLADR